MSFNSIGIESKLDMPRIRHLFKIGLIAAFMVLAGDMILGWGAAEESVNGIPPFLARYLTVSDTRLLWAAILGMIGIPMECLCYFGIYRLIASKSEKICAQIPHGNYRLSDIRRLRRSRSMQRTCIFYERDVCG